MGEFPGDFVSTVAVKHLIFFPSLPNEIGHASLNATKAAYLRCGFEKITGLFPPP